MTKVCVDGKRARHGRTSAELFPSSSFYRSIYPRFNSTSTTRSALRDGNLLFTHVTVVTFYFYIKNFARPYIPAQDFVLVYEIRELGVPAGLCGKRRVLSYCRQVGTQWTSAIYPFFPPRFIQPFFNNYHPPFSSPSETLGYHRGCNTSDVISKYALRQFLQLSRMKLNRTHETSVLLMFLAMSTLSSRGPKRARQIFYRGDVQVLLAINPAGCFKFSPNYRTVNFPSHTSSRPLPYFLSIVLEDAKSLSDRLKFHKRSQSSREKSIKFPRGALKSFFLKISKLSQNNILSKHFFSASVIFLANPLFSLSSPFSLSLSLLLFKIKCSDF